MTKVVKNFEKISKELNLVLTIYIKNIEALSQIYTDLEVIKVKRLDELQNEIKEWSEHNTGKPTSEMIHLRKDWSEDNIHYSHHIDWITLNAFYISAFTMFEHTLARIIEIATQKLQPKVKPKDIRGNGELDSLRKYLWLIFNIDAANSDHRDWAELMDFWAVRNALVHSGGLLNKEGKTDLEKVRGFNLVKKYGIWYRSTALYIRILDARPIIGFGGLSGRYLENIVRELSLHQEIKASSP